MIIPMPPSFPFVDERGYLTSRAQEFVLEVHKQSVIIGTGSPEGVLEAPQWSEYIDDSGTTGSLKWVKKLEDISGDRTQGWILI